MRYEEYGVRTMVIGAGEAGVTLIKEIFNARMVREKSASCGECNVCVDRPHCGRPVAAVNPVCIIDSSLQKQGMDICGVRVMGTEYDISRLVVQERVEQIILAIPSLNESDRKRIIDICTETKLPLKIIPFLGDLMLDSTSRGLAAQVRDINCEELLGRDPIRFDNEDIKAFVSGKRCMVTGGGGSIGSELVRQIARYDPEQIIIVDIYENNAYEIQQELVMEYGDRLNLVTLIASVRDFPRMSKIFRQYRPQVVFHAAAHKHVPLMEASPMEAIKNNVMGTFYTASLAQCYEAEKFVMISTDKAVNPTNVMGASKRCCEMIVQYFSQQHDGPTKFVTTRFGNVLGSNGSVIQLFKRQIEKGGPVTVTHPDIIRYFMTIPEAVSLVMEAAAIAEGSEIFVLDMGEPVKIVTLAENIIRMYGKRPYSDIKIMFTGLRPGEKLKEELLMSEEGLRRTKNELIFIGQQIDIDMSTFAVRLSKLKKAAEENNEPVAIAAMHEMVPTFTTPEEFNGKLAYNS